MFLENEEWKEVSELYGDWMEPLRNMQVPLAKTLASPEIVATPFLIEQLGQLKAMFNNLGFRMEVMDTIMSEIMGEMTEEVKADLIAKTQETMAKRVQKRQDSIKEMEEKQSNIVIPQKGPIVAG